MLPSETAIIAIGVATAGSTDPRIALLIACAAAGSFLGDNLSYLLGRRFAPAVERRFFSTGKGARLGGKASEDNPWAGLLITFATAIVVSRLIETARRIRSRWPRTTRRDGASGPSHRTPPYAPRRPSAGCRRN